jgi:hypothetical protein
MTTSPFTCGMASIDHAFAQGLTLAMSILVQPA